MAILAPSSHHLAENWTRTPLISCRMQCLIWKANLASWHRWCTFRVRKSASRGPVTGAVTRFSLKPKCNTEAIERFSLVKNIASAFLIYFLVISIGDEHGEEDEDDYETKDMGLHDMDAMN